MWAEQHPEHPVELNWIGEGELESAMEKQPLPQTVSQRFFGRLDQPSRLKVFARCGVIVLPSRLTTIPGLMQEVSAAGLLVMGNRRNPTIRRSVQHQLNGWLYDPAQGGDTFKTLSTIMSQTPEPLDGKRAASQTPYPCSEAAAVLTDIDPIAYAPVHPAVSEGQAA